MIQVYYIRAYVLGPSRRLVTQADARQKTGPLSWPDNRMSGGTQRGPWEVV